MYICKIHIYIYIHTCIYIYKYQGRLLDLNARGDLKLNQLRYLVLDEADQMLEIGFKEDMEKIIESVCAGAAQVCT